jgi:murein DD-endopeptidase MepM/ murein hydrolase activator NlpD
LNCSLKKFLQVFTLVALMTFILPSMNFGNVFAQSATEKKAAPKKKVTPKKKPVRKKTTAKPAAKKVEAPKPAPKVESTTATVAIPKSMTPENAAAKVLLSPKVSVDKTVIAPSGFESNSITRQISVPRGENFTRTLARNGVVQGEAIALTKVIDKSGFISSGDIKAGQKMSLTQSLKSGAKSFVSLDITFDKNTIQILKTGEKKYKVRRVPNSMIKKEEPEKVIPKDSNVVKKTFKSGPINSSLVELARSINIPREVLADTVKILSGRHDLSKVIQRRDRFSVLYEEVYDKNNKKVGRHKVLFASIKGPKNNIKAYRFSPTGKEANVDYYDESGMPYRSSITNRPLKGKHRITSGFGYRTHPVLKRRILHSGTDFGAPTGTPITAAGDGVITQVGRFGGYGNYIKIKHDSTYETSYGHMSRYAAGMKKLRKVRKGEVIGYVGSTGRSTGAHLHFELIKRGVKVNSERERLPSGRKLAGKDGSNFRNTVNEVNGAVTRLTEKAKKL